MDIRERHFGRIASQIPDSADVEVDLDALIRRLILFDRCIIESIGLKEIPALIALFGAEGFVELMDSGSIEIVCDVLTAGQVGQTAALKSFDARGGPLPLGSFRLVTVGLPQDDASREQYVHSALQEVHKVPISIKRAQKVKRSLVEHLRSYPLDSARAGIVDTQDEILRMSPFIWEAIRFATMNDVGLDIGRVPSFTSDDLGNEGDIRIETNLIKKHSLSPELAHKVVERGILAAAGLNQRVRMMEGLNALTGFQNQEFPLFDEKLSVLARQLDPDAHEIRFERVVTLGGLPGAGDLLLTGGTLDVHKLLSIRQSSACHDLRDWIRNVDIQTDQEIETQFKSVKSHFASMIDSKAGKSIRFLVTTGTSFVPVVGAVASPLLGAADQFLLERVIGKPGPATFLSSSYRSLFDS
jgi:hypothetical protein